MQFVCRSLKNCRTRVFKFYMCHIFFRENINPVEPDKTVNRVVWKNLYGKINPTTSLNKLSKAQIGGKGKMMIFPKPRMSR